MYTFLNLFIVYYKQNTKHKSYNFTLKLDSKTCAQDLGYNNKNN